MKIDCTGDVVSGDIITFTETVWGGSRTSPRALGERTITARVLKESYGQEKQQHTFSLFILESTGYEALPEGKKTLRKGRNVYRNGCTRERWEDEEARRAALDEKHARGDAARAIRDERIFS